MSTKHASIKKILLTSIKNGFAFSIQYSCFLFISSAILELLLIWPPKHSYHFGTPAFWMFFSSIYMFIPTFLFSTTIIFPFKYFIFDNFSSKIKNRIKMIVLWSSLAIFFVNSLTLLITYKFEKPPSIYPILAALGSNWNFQYPATFALNFFLYKKFNIPLKRYTIISFLLFVSIWFIWSWILGNLIFN
jgi:hypothetical protein